MFQKIVRTSALFLALAFIALPASVTYAQSTGTNVVTGGDPEPTGEPTPPPPPPKTNATTASITLAILIALGLA